MNRFLNRLLIIPLFFTVNIMFAQVKNISGTITDENKAPLPGASLIVMDSSKGTSSDFDGNYTLNVTIGDQIEVKYLGFKPQRFTVVDNKNVYDLALLPDNNEMDEVLVVAYGRTSKESVTGAISSISLEQIEKRPISSALVGLEGSAPGIQVHSTGGTDGVTIRIRGFSSLNNNSPLYIVDGVPRGNSSDINPADIQSISVLKDASSAALYGSRASNGVVLIETKRGRGKSELNFSVKQGLFGRGAQEYDKVEANDFMELMWQGYRNSLLTDRPGMGEPAANLEASNSLVDNYLGINIYNIPDSQLFDGEGRLNPNAQILPGYAGDLNWWRPIERMGLRREYNLSARNGSEKGGVYFSLSYLGEEGYLKGTDLSRLTGNMRADYDLNDWLSVGGTMRGVHRETDDMRSPSSNSNAAIFSARHIAPIYPVHLHDPITGEYILDDAGNKIYDSGDETRKQFVGRNAISQQFLDTRKSFRTALDSDFWADIKFLNDFKFSIKGNISLRNTESRVYQNSEIGPATGTKGSSTINKNRYKDITSQQLLNWNRSFGNHFLEALIGHESNKESSQYLSARKVNEIFFGEDNLNNFTMMERLDDYGSTYANEGYFGRAKYNYDHKYYGEFSFRRDGSSRFAKNHRWGNFWSIGGSWILTKEKFFSLDFIDNLKLRASYGEVGNDSGANLYAYHSLYNIDQNNNIPAFYKSQSAAQDLIWETSSSFNIGIDTRVLNRINFTAEYFDKRSQNLIFDVRLPLSAGSTGTSSATPSVTKNLGSISNRGLELSFDFDIIKHQDWNWNFGANATFLKNKITKLPEENREEGIISGNKRRVEGGGIYDYWMYQFLGVDKKTGNVLYEIDDKKYNANATSDPSKEDIPAQYLVSDISGGKYYTNKTNYAKKDWSGSAIPDVFGSFNTSIQWKDFSLSALFTYQVGGKIYDEAYRELMRNTGAPKAHHKDMLKAWQGVPSDLQNTPEDRIDPHGVPKMDFTTSSDNNTASNRFLFDASYLLIKNITLSYNVPQNTIEKLKLSNINLYFAIENPALFTSSHKGINPFQSFAGTSGDDFYISRVFTLGLNIRI